MNLVLHRAEVHEREITLEVYALTKPPSPEVVHAERDGLRMRPDWLPGLVSHRTLRFSFKCQLPSLLQLRHRETNHRINRGTDGVVAEWQRPLADGVVGGGWGVGI